MASSMISSFPLRSLCSRWIFDVAQKMSERCRARRLACEQSQQLRRGARLAEQLALCEVTGVAAQEVELAQGLDTFGDHFHAEAASHLNDGFHDRRIAGVLAHIADE